MKIRIWLLLAVMAFCLLTVIRPVSARMVVSLHPDRARLLRLLVRSDAAVEPAPGHGKGTRSARPGRKHPVASDNPAELAWYTTDPPPDRRGQADDNQDDGTDANLTASEQPDPPPEWQMTRPDSQRANSFIHAKAKPPP